MNENILVKPTPARNLGVTHAPIRELCNFLIYGRNLDILNERSRRQPFPRLEKTPTNVREVGEILGARKCEKGRKLYFDCTDFANHRGILIHNYDAQFWVHYFRNGIGLVGISCFQQLVSAEGSVLPSMTQTIDDSDEYQWFTHDLGDKYFQAKKGEIYLNKLADYFLEKVNPRLISPYAIYAENRQVNEPYKFVKGNLERLKEILKQAFFVLEGIEQGKNQEELFRRNLSVAITCGNLKQKPWLENRWMWFINEVGRLALQENVPYTVLEDGGYRRSENYYSDWIRRKKHHLYLDFYQEVLLATPREKVAARYHLVKWLQEQGSKGEWIINYYKLADECP